MSVGQKHTYVGQFFEELGHIILGGVLSRDERGDIYLPSSKTSIEVKGSSFQSSYGFRLSVNQVERYETQAASGLTESSWYMLFAYRNRSLRGRLPGRRVTELSSHETQDSIHGYLSTSVLWGAIVDLSIVNRWKERLPKQRKSIMGHLGVMTVDVKCPVFEGIVQSDLDGHLRQMGLNPHIYKKVSFSADTKRRRTNDASVVFPVTAVVKGEDARMLRRLLRRRGFSVRFGNV